MFWIKHFCRRCQSGPCKHDGDAKVIHAVGSKHTDGADVYVAVTKLFPKIGILVDTTLRLTKGNQWGILGFGGDRNDNYYPQFEGSLGYLPSFIPGLVVGVEYRTKPRNQNFTPESNWFDVRQLFCQQTPEYHSRLCIAGHHRNLPHPDGCLFLTSDGVLRGHAKLLEGAVWPIRCIRPIFLRLRSSLLQDAC